MGVMDGGDGWGPLSFVSASRPVATRTVSNSSASSEKKKDGDTYRTNGKCDMTRTVSKKKNSPASSEKRR